MSNDALTNIGLFLSLAIAVGCTLFIRHRSKKAGTKRSALYFVWAGTGWGSLVGIVVSMILSLILYLVFDVTTNESGIIVGLGAGSGWIVLFVWFALGFSYLVYRAASYYIDSTIRTRRMIRTWLRCWAKDLLRKRRSDHHK